ncbi:MAG TPA: AAA family ATPase [Steroidobacteraceae bacterium]|nr:AAA family ATPase [Steroidobacteraceae bacterium]
MSLIESAFDKMRRAGVESEGPNPPARPLTHLAALAAPPDAEPAYRQVSIDLEALRAAGYLPEKDHERRLADYYRQIKRPLIERALAAPDVPQMRLILVTSPLPGDGKTFTSINLALSMARERDTSTLLVDADLPKAHISRAFGFGGEPGLVDALLDESIDVESLILRTNVRGLDILPAGTWVDSVTELLSSARMAQVAARLASRPRRLALLDSSPVLVSIEARSLVQIPGQVVLVLRSGKTPRPAALDAIAQLDKKKLQGLILNDSRAPSGGYYYGYSYYGTGNDGTSRGG